VPDQRRYYIDATGCGNTLNTQHPKVMQLILDSMRYWVETMHVDGFRFDLAAVLGRTERGYEQEAPLLNAIRQDPVLSRVKLIAEPWDLGMGGHQLGGFPPGFSEWNDRYRDAVRRFWRGDAGVTPEFAARLLGSAEIFDRRGRRPQASLNFVTAHDGFTLADLVSYVSKHNEANGEDNRDGHNANYSANFGIEGETDNSAIVARRWRQMRNLVMTLLFSQGTPMLVAGDEIGNSQSGNNNAYCQDSELGWVNWPEAGESDKIDFHRFVRKLLRFRREHRVLRQPYFLHGRERVDGAPDIRWLAPEGGEPTGRHWGDAQWRCLGLVLRGSAEVAQDVDGDALFIIINAGRGDAKFTIPDARDGFLWRAILTSTTPDGHPDIVHIVMGGMEISVEGLSILVFREEARNRGLAPVAEARHQ